MARRLFTTNTVAFACDGVLALQRLSVRHACRLGMAGGGTDNGQKRQAAQAREEP